MDSYVMLGEERMARATSGSEVGLELDPQRAKIVEVYGFVGWIASFAAWIGYLLWTYLPESVLHDVGVSYYPNKYWALAAPATLVLAVCSYTTVYGAIGLASNPPLSARDTLSDGYSKRLVLPVRRNKKLGADGDASGLNQSAASMNSSSFHNGRGSRLLSDRTVSTVSQLSSDSDDHAAGNGEQQQDIAEASGSLSPVAEAVTEHPVTSVDEADAAPHLCAECHAHAQQPSSASPSDAATASSLHLAHIRNATASSEYAGSGGGAVTPSRDGSPARVLDRSQALVYYVSTPQPPSGQGSGGMPGSPLGSRRQSSGSGSGTGLIVQSTGTNITGASAGAGGGSVRDRTGSAASGTGLGGHSPAVRSQQQLASLFNAPLRMTIDPFMTTPDLADLPVTLVNKLQFTAGPRWVKRRSQRA
jgi:hypothetical protein